MTGRWTFSPSVLQATREPPLPQPVQLQALREMLADIGVESESLQWFLGQWRSRYVPLRNDPDAEFTGNGIALRISGDEVILTPLYDQWGDALYVYVPLVDVEDMLDQFETYVRDRESSK